MNSLLDLLNEKQKNYEDAKSDLIKAMVSVSKLDQEQRNQLVTEIISMEAGVELFTAMKQYYR